MQLMQVLTAVLALCVLASHLSVLSQQFADSIGLTYSPELITPQQKAALMSVLLVPTLVVFMVCVISFYCSNYLLLQNILAKTWLNTFCGSH